jgi:hypothetical protein
MVSVSFFSLLDMSACERQQQTAARQRVVGRRAGRTVTALACMRSGESALRRLLALAAAHAPLLPPLSHAPPRSC